MTIIVSGQNPNPQHVVPTPHLNLFFPFHLLPYPPFLLSHSLPHTHFPPPLYAQDGDDGASRGEVLGDCLWGTLFCPDVGMLPRGRFTKKAPDFPAWGGAITSQKELYLPPPMNGSIEDCAGADNKEYLGRWAKVKGEFHLGIETHLPAFTSKAFWECFKGVGIPVQGIFPQRGGVMERDVVLLLALKLRGCVTSGCSSHLSEPYFFPCTMSRMMGEKITQQACFKI